MNLKLTNASSRVTTNLHSRGGYTNTLAWIESVCMFKLGVNKTIEFVPTFLENFETAEEVLRDSTRVVIVMFNAKEELFRGV